MNIERISTLRRALAGVALACAGLGLATGAAAQAVYQYTGNPFTLFSCGGATLCATPGPNPNTSYTTTDFVSAKLELSAPLAPNLVFQDISGLAGFRLTLEDRHQVMVAGTAGTGSFEAKVSTDSAGQIIGPWSLFVNCCFFPNNSVATLNNPGGRGVGDLGVLSGPTAAFPNTPNDSGFVFGNPRAWTSGPPNPGVAVMNLVTLVNGTELGLTVGQVNGLTDKLNNILASISAGLNKQATNQLRSFVSSVESAHKTGKMLASTAATLVAAANAIIALLA